MHKSYKSKGQWYIISAVMITGALLLISFLIKNYFISDPSDVARLREDFLFNNMKEQLNRTVDISSCDDLDSNLNEFVYFTRQRMAEKGVLLLVNFSVSSCPPKVVTFSMALASDKMSINQTWTYE